MSCNAGHILTCSWSQYWCSCKSKCVV